MGGVSKTTPTTRVVLYKSIKDLDKHIVVFKNIL